MCFTVLYSCQWFFFFFQAEDGIRDGHVIGVQTCALPIYHPADLREGHREQHEIEAAQPEAEAEIADDRSERRGEYAADPHTDPGAQAEAHGEQRGRIAADAHEGCVPGGELPRVAAHDVPGLTEIGIEEDEDHDGDEVGADDPGQRGEHGQGQEHEQLHEAHEAVRPKRPAGRKRRMAMRRPKLTSSFIEGERNTAPMDSATETRMPPTKAPGRLPMPPMITMLNEVTDSPSPLAG